MPTIDEGDLRALFGQTPEEAVAYFKSKAYRAPTSQQIKKAKGQSIDKQTGVVHDPDPKTPWVWSDTLGCAHDRAFTVARVMRLDLLKDIRSAVQTAIDQGQSYGTFQKNLKPILVAKGWWGNEEILNPKTGQVEKTQLGSARRLRTIYRTNMDTAYAAGKYLQRMELREDMPYWRYIAVRDSRTRPLHRSLHNKVFRWDDPFWNTHTPPNGWNCRCDVESMDSADIQKRFGKNPEQVITKTNDADYTAKTVKIQGKEIEVKGYKLPNGNTIYPDAGWDYCPGKHAWEEAQLLAERLKSTPMGVRTAFETEFRDHLEQAFPSYVQTVMDSGIHRGRELAVGLLSAELQKSLPVENASPVMIISDSAILHALRDSKESKSIAMPVSLLGRLPQWLQTYESRWENPGALVLFSEPFKEGGKSWRWKVVFEIEKERKMLVFKTSTKVTESDINQYENLK